MSRAVTIGLYLAFVAGALALVVAARRRPDRVASLAELLRAAMADRSARVVLVLFWWWIGWHFLVSEPIPV